MKEPRLQKCLDEGKQVYEVPELTKAYHCANRDRLAVTKQLKSLQTDVKAIEAK